MPKNIEASPSEESEEQAPAQIEFQEAMKKIEGPGESNPKAIKSEKAEEENRSDKKDKSRESAEDPQDELLDKSQEMEEKWSDIFSDVNKIGDLLGDQISRDLIAKFTEKISGNSKEKFSGDKDELTVGGGENDTRTSVDKFIEKANEGNIDMSGITRITAELRRLIADLKKAHKQESRKRMGTDAMDNVDFGKMKREEKSSQEIKEEKLKAVEVAEGILENLERKTLDLSKCAKDISKIVRRVEKVN